MSDLWFQLGLVLVLVVINAAFAGTELAMVSLREGQLQRLEKRSGTGAVLAQLARQPNQFLATIQIGITLAGQSGRRLTVLLPKGWASVLFLVTVPVVATQTLRRWRDRGATLHNARRADTVADPR